jgi:hypothetical protein
MTTETIFPDIYTSLAGYLGVSITTAIAIMSIITIWTLIWKGIALWKSAKRKQLPWFIALLVINTVGILEILYIYVFSEINFSGKSKNKKQKKSTSKKK